ncbi:hypothetical protein [Escherichia coli]|uniref:hypothetical protein n=1 Tax=Escherichia coli TaxID=562 RepID=UPI0019CA8698|nr:hypothetical protein [Escherichia coli]CAD5648397.1 Uncharacterised protein [Escherichia coli]CAD6110696.1 Uncharacterised protein [Escherichia coli]
MTKDELFEKLKPLAVSLQNSLISKQHAFNINKAVVDECKLNGISNKLIVEAINSHLHDDEKITLLYFKNLLSRSKIKNVSGVESKTGELPSQDDSSTQTTKEPAIKGFFSQREKERKLEYDASATMAKFEDKYK